MSSSIGRVVQRLLEERYRVWEGPEDLAVAFAALAAEACTAPWAAVALRGGETVHFARQGETGGERYELPIRYQDEELGVLAVGRSRDGDTQVPRLAQEVAKALAHQLRRSELLRGARERFGRELPLLGP